MDGYYNLIQPAGICTVKALLDGFLPAQQTVTVNAGKLVEVNLLLSTIPTADNETSSEGSGSKPCVVSELFTGSSEKKYLKTLRRARDKILNNSTPGRKYVAMYYQHSPEVANILGSDARLRREVRECILRNFGVVGAILKGEFSRLELKHRKDVSSCLKKLADRSSPGMRHAVSQFLNEMENNSFP